VKDATTIAGLAAAFAVLGYLNIQDSHRNEALTADDVTHWRPLDPFGPFGGSLLMMNSIYDRGFKLVWDRTDRGENVLIAHELYRNGSDFIQCVRTTKHDDFLANPAGRDDEFVACFELVKPANGEGLH
jgi:hypothetical protein